MRKYYYKDAAGQHGPLPIEKLKGKGITAETPVWYDPLPKWTTAGQVDELKVLFTPIVRTPAVTTTTVIPVTPVVEMPKEEKPAVVTPVTPKVAVTTSAATTPIAVKSTTTVRTRPAQQKSTAWISWVLGLLILGGVGYYIYQDMEKNKDQTDSSTELNLSENSADTSNAQSINSTAADTATSPMVTTETPEDTIASVTTTTTTTTDPALTPSTLTTAQDKKAQAKKKAEEDKKKQLAAQTALDKQKAEQDKKEKLAAEAALAKELHVRNNWSKYITTGSLNYQKKGDDGMTAFDIPVYNGTDAVLNKVIVRVDYYKKEKKDKIVYTETVVINNIPPKSTLNGKGPEKKNAMKAVVTITGINSKNLHFCYPQNSGNNADPYYCN